jgi:hypothetical protein
LGSLYFAEHLKEKWTTSATKLFLMYGGFLAISIVLFLMGLAL